MFDATRRSALAALFAVLAAGAAPLRAQPTGVPLQFVYVLHVATGKQDPAAWTEADKAAVSRHFERLSKAKDAGQVILAGRTDEALDKTFGLVVFEAESEAAAKTFMAADPAIVAGVMTATLHRYAVALLRSK